MLLDIIQGGFFFGLFSYADFCLVGFGTGLSLLFLFHAAIALWFWSKSPLFLLFFSSTCWPTTVSLPTSSRVGSLSAFSSFPVRLCLPRKLPSRCRLGFRSTRMIGTNQGDFRTLLPCVALILFPALRIARQKVHACAVVPFAGVDPPLFIPRRCRLPSLSSEVVIIVTTFPL